MKPSLATADSAAFRSCTRRTLTAAALLLAATAARPAFAHPPISLDIVGQWGGGSYAVAVDGNIAYAAVGTQLLIFDLSDPGQPTLLAKANVLSSYPLDLVVQGDYLFAGGARLDIIDVSNPAEPSCVAAWDYPWDSVGFIAVAGNVAYVAGTNDELWLVDVSEPASPTLISSIATVGRPRHLDAVGSYAYLADEDAGLLIIDASDPTAPSIAGQFQTQGKPYDVAVREQYAYVATSQRGIQIVDVSNPTQPVWVNDYAPFPFFGNVNIVGSLLYATLPLGSACIADLTNPTAPTAVTRTAPDGGTVSAAAGTNGTAVLGCFSRGVYLTNIQDPNHPTTTASYLGGTVGGIALTGSTIVSYGWDAFAIDVSNPTAPTLIQTLGFHWQPKDIIIVDGIAYVIADDVAGDMLQIIDMTDPTAPTGLGSVAIAGGDGRRVTVADGYAYVAADNGLQIFDVHDPTQPQLVGSAGTLTPTLDVVVVGRYAYAVSMLAGVQVCDVINPALPQWMGAGVSGVLAGSWASLDVVDDLLLVASDYGALSVLDLTDPTAPQLVGTYGVQFYGSFRYVRAAGNLAYLLGDDLSLLDISDPTTPTLLMTHPVGRLLYRPILNGSYLYGDGGESGLIVLQTTYPGDLNCDGRIDAGDVNPFVARLIDPTQYASQFARCADLNGDLNGDGAVDFADINPFVDLLTAR